MLVAGDRLGAYRIIRTLGAGGMGCVYEAEHVGLKVRRALKVFSTESEHHDLLRKRFVAEGRILADLQHPRIVRVYDFALDEASGTPYFSMDLVLSPQGVPQTLEDACRSGITEQQVADWFRDICEGLGYIHSKGVIHRDISLDNILIGADGHAVIGDFGIAKITGETYRRKIEVSVTMPLPGGEGVRWGKGLYLAPELKHGGVATPASDAYAVGVLLFRLLVGSWYTPETKLNDILAGMEYNWAEIIARLCAEECRSRLPVAGIASVPELLRHIHEDSMRRARIFVVVFAALAVFAALFIVWRFRSEAHEKIVRFGERKAGRQAAEVTPEQVDTLKNDILVEERRKKR